MRIPRIYCSQALQNQTSVQLDRATTHYVTKVLRLEKGRALTLFDGSNHVFQASITGVTKSTCSVDIQSSEHRSLESPLHTHLAIGVSRGERMDWVLQKATELGISEITPLFTERTEVKLKGERLEKKMQHWQQVMISACEQCGRNRLPKLNPANALETWQTPTSALNLVLHHRSTQSLTNHPKPAATTLIIGPEGGLSEEEIRTLLEEKTCHALTLGPRILRTETAPIVALSTVQHL